MSHQIATYWLVGNVAGAPQAVAYIIVPSPKVGKPKSAWEVVPVRYEGTTPEEAGERANADWERGLQKHRDAKVAAERRKAERAEKKPQPKDQPHDQN